MERALCILAENCDQWMLPLAERVVQCQQISAVISSTGSIPNNWLSVVQFNCKVVQCADKLFPSRTLFYLYMIYWFTSSQSTLIEQSHGLRSHFHIPLHLCYCVA